MSAITKQLEAYYHKEGISSLDFRCLHAPSCKKGYNDFTEAKATLVGAGYEQSIPRLVFISLDPGGEPFYRQPQNRTLLSVQKYEMERDVAALPKNRHWYRTVELALNILKKYKGYHDLQMNQATRYFAHVNTVKCCVNNPGNKTADSRLFRNCRRFVPHELEILKPNIIVTQGVKAQRSIENCFGAYDNSNYLKLVSDHPELSVLNMNKHPVLWIKTYHPCRRDSFFNRQRREKFSSFTERSKDFITLLRKDSRIKPSLKPSVSDINNITGKRETMSTFEKGLKKRWPGLFGQPKAFFK